MARKSNYSHRKKGRKAPSAGKRLLHLIEFVICFGVIGGFGYLTYQFTTESDKFLVKHVQIEGIRKLDEELVLETSGLMDQGNVLYLNIGEVKASVESLPYVLSCTVKQVFPDTVLLIIEERIPVLSLQLNSQSYEVDINGVVLREYSPREIPMSPFISNVGGVNFVDVGEPVAVPAFDEAIRLWQAFSALPMADELTVSEISAQSTNELLMYCDELIYEIRWGNGDIEKQAARLGVLWEELNGAIPCKSYLDLRFEEDLACK